MIIFFLKISSLRNREYHTDYNQGSFPGTISDLQSTFSPKTWLQRLESSIEKNILKKLGKQATAERQQTFIMHRQQ